MRVDTEAELRARVARVPEDSELVIAQDFMPSEFDWRIGVLGGEPLFACRYHMARGHWQIVAHERPRQSAATAASRRCALDDAPPEAVQIAVRAARLIGDGLYGVDVKESAGRFP